LKPNGKYFWQNKDKIVTLTTDIDFTKLHFGQKVCGHIIVEEIKFQAKISDKKLLILFTFDPI
jgi:hypothetical protein